LETIWKHGCHVMDFTLSNNQRPLSTFDDILNIIFSFLLENYYLKMKYIFIIIIILLNIKAAAAAE
jgi:hypothetical protein